MGGGTIFSGGYLAPAWGQPGCGYIGDSSGTSFVFGNGRDSFEKFTCSNTQYAGCVFPEDMSDGNGFGLGCYALGLQWNGKCWAGWDSYNGNGKPPQFLGGGTQYTPVEGWEMWELS
jgi:hypothetical protein